MNGNLIVGIAPSGHPAKKDFAVAYRAPGAIERELGKFTNDQAGFQQLHQALASACKTHEISQIRLIVEATGGYEAALMAYAYEQGWGASMPGCPLGPKQVRDWAKGAQGAPRYRVKTAPSGPPVDARILAHYGAAPSGHPFPPLRPQLASEVTALDSLLKRRLDLEKTLHQE